MPKQWLDDNGLPDVPRFPQVPGGGLGKLTFTTDKRGEAGATWASGQKREMVDPAVKSILEVLGDTEKNRRLARRVVRLKGRYPKGTLPELMTVDYLERLGQWYMYQVPILGGRVSGGAVADIVTQSGAAGIVIRVQGEYWHSKRDAKQRDAAAALSMLGAKAGSLTITNVVDAWEDDIYKDVARVLNFAFAGIGLRG